MPQVTAQWSDGTSSTVTTNRYLQYYPIFAFNTQDFIPDLLPEKLIPYKKKETEVVNGATLSALIENVLQEISTRKERVKKDRYLTNFTILQDKNFNYKQLCGLIVLAFKEYPFVVKLFLEKPETLFDFHATGVEPTFFFYMGGGSNRHMSGFTRIQNRKRIESKIETLDRWKEHVVLPRKWFWMPQSRPTIVLTGKNIGGLDHAYTEIPGTYAIIADKVDFSQQTNLLTNDKKRKMFMQLCNDLELNIDPHAKNFALFEDRIRKKFTIVLVDTEHFPTMVGPLNRTYFRNHNEWYVYLCGKCFHDMFLQTKRDLQEQGRRSVLKHRRADYAIT